MVVTQPTPTANTTPTTPGYATSAERLKKLRRRRADQRLGRQVFKGKWKEVLLDLGKTQFPWDSSRQYGGKIGEMFTKVNLIEMGIAMHATVLTGNPVRTIVDEGLEDQADAIADIRDRSLFDQLLNQAAIQVYTERIAPVMIRRTELGVSLCLEENERTFPVGPNGPDAQPTVWERRWVIERQHPGEREPRRYLRVERHWAPDGVGVIDQEVYKTESVDVLQDLTELQRLPLASVLPDPPEERQFTGLDRPAIVQLVSSVVGGEPVQLLDPEKLSVMDSAAAALTRVNRTHAQHAEPKARVPEGIVDDDGQVDMQKRVFTDPEKEFEYLIADFKFSDMLDFFDRLCQWLMVELRISQALIGFKAGGGSAPDSYDKLRLESTSTLALAEGTALYFTGALRVLFGLASQMDASLPLRGYATGRVDIKMRPELPKDEIEQVREEDEKLRAGLTSRRRAIVAIHGEDQADAVMEEIEADEERETRRQQAGIFGAVPSMSGTDPNDDPAAPSDDGGRAAA